MASREPRDLKRSRAGQRNAVAASAKCDARGELELGSWRALAGIGEALARLSERWRDRSSRLLHP